MMKKVGPTKLLVIAGIWLIICLGSPLLAQDGRELVKGKKYHPKIESVLGRLAEEYSQNKLAARDFAFQRKIAFQDDVVIAILVPPPGSDASVIDKESLSLYGVTVQAVSRHLVMARIPISKLLEIADGVNGISYIRLPFIPLPASVLSEGVALTNAVDYQSEGYEGQNTRVAVIDLGFNQLEDFQNVGELPSDIISKDYTGEGLTTGTSHGTKVAQIVYDMAPRAQLYFIKIANEVDLENAKDYCISQEIDIINHSWGWPNTNFTDGTGLVCDIANDAESHNILWVNAAGNAAQQHYQHSFSDTDGDGWHEFSSGGDESNSFAGDPWVDVTIFLTWDAWPTTNQDYDLYLYDSNSKLLAFSTNQQTGTQPPTERIIYRVPGYGTHNIRIHNSDASGNEDLKIVISHGELEYRTAAHSIWSPADAVGVISVGAINQANWETGPQEKYSSQGPTNDGRIKPDISGPDGVTRYAYGGVGRGYGTSYATPHVAGAASLLLSKYPDCRVAQLQSTLESWAIDMGTSDKDNVYGAGRLNLLLLPPLGYLTDIKVYPNPFRPSEGHARIIFDKLTPGVRIRIFTISGELVANSGELRGEEIWTWDMRNERGEIVSRGTYIYFVTNSYGGKKIGKIAVIK